MVHRERVEGYTGTLAELAEDLGNLRYDSLGQFLELLAAKLVAEVAPGVEVRVLAPGESVEL